MKIKIFQKILDIFNKKNRIRKKIKKFEKKYDLTIRENTSDLTVVIDVLKKEQYKPLTTLENVNTIIDAGGNIGCTSIYLAQKYPNAKIYTIEPDKDNFNVLVKNTKKYKNIIPINKGLWGENKILEIVNNGLGEWGIQTFETENINQENVIETITMTDLMNQYNINTIDILKIDIEGAEKNVFSYNYEWLKKVRQFSIELHDRMVNGCSNTFFKCISNYPEFKMSIHSEDLIFENTQLEN